MSSIPDYKTTPVSVEARSIYEPTYSNPLENIYVFSYLIKITNHGKTKTQLLSRQWIITDATGQARIVEGEGVVGQQPIILPGQTYEYTSWLQLETPIGAMEGHYVMEEQYDRGHRKKIFLASVPKMIHIAPELLN